MSYRKSLLTIVFAALVLTFSLNVSALLRIGSGGTSSTKTCPDGSVVPSDSTCPGSTLQGSVWGIYWSGNLPTDPAPLYGGLLPGGGDFALKCSQGTSDCPDGVPVIRYTGSLIFKKGSPNTITINGMSNWTDLGFPASNFKIQVAGSSFNDGTYSVLSADANVLTLGDRLAKNETANATAALSNVLLQFSNSTGVVGTGKVYFRHYEEVPQADGPALLQTILNPSNQKPEDGVATASGQIPAVVVCATTGTTLHLPCTFKAFAGDGQSSDFHFDKSAHNFAVCGGNHPSSASDDCYIFARDGDRPNTGFCKKFYPQTTELALCQTFATTVTAGASASSILQRAVNTQMGTNSDPTTLSFDGSHLATTNAQGQVTVDITINPNPINTGGSSTSVVTVKILNNGAANLSGIDVNSVVVIFRNYDQIPGPGITLTATVPNDGAPTQCAGDSNCWNFKFNRNKLLCAFEAVFPQSGNTIPDGTPIPVNVEGSYSASGGGIAGFIQATNNGAFSADPLTVCQ